MNNVIASGQYTITDLTDGINSYTIALTLENISISCDEYGVVKDNEIGNPSCKAKSKIKITLGDKALIPIGENDLLSEGKFKYSISSSDSVNCVGDRISDDEFYIKEISDKTGELSISIYVESNLNIYTKKLTWNKNYDGQGVGIVSIVGHNYFSYDNKEDTTPTPSYIELEAIVNNIKTYNISWKFRNNESSSWNSIISSNGCEIIDRTRLKLNDTKLFLNDSRILNIQVHVRDTIRNKDIYATTTITKVFNGFDSPYIKINGGDTFKYSDGSLIPFPENIRLEVTSYYIDNPKYIWEYFDNEWKVINSVVGSIISGNSLTIDDKVLFGTKESVIIRCYTEKYGNLVNDSITIKKVYDGKDSKTVSIIGPNNIRYTVEGGAVPEIVELEAIQKNYKDPVYEWYIYDGGKFVTLNKTTQKLSLSHIDLEDANIIKVECKESNGNDLSYFEFQVTKIYDGNIGDVYDVFITEGTRNICYNGRGKLVSTNIEPFKVEVYKNGENVIGTTSVKNITWSSKGHYSEPATVGNISFIPVPLNMYDDEKLDTSISVIINCEGRVLKSTIPITVSKNSSALEWVEDWDGTQVEIGGKYIISPKIFAGKKNDQTNCITGIAIGQDIINNNDNIGMAIYHENKLLGRINADPTVDNNNLISFGDPEQGRLVIKVDGSMTIESGVIIDETKKIYEDISNSEKNAIDVSNDNVNKKLEGYVDNDTHNLFVSGTDEKLLQVDKNIKDTANSVKEDLIPGINDVKQEQEKYKKYIRFSDGTIVLGDEHSTLKLKLQNDRIQFLQSGVEVAYISNNKLYITDAEINNSLRIGSFIWKPRSNGNLSFTWNG